MVIVPNKVDDMALLWYLDFCNGCIVKNWLPDQTEVRAGLPASSVPAVPGTCGVCVRYERPLINIYVGVQLIMV